MYVWVGVCVKGKHYRLFVFLALQNPERALPANSNRIEEKRRQSWAHGVGGATCLISDTVDIYEYEGETGVTRKLGMANVGWGTSHIITIIHVKYRLHKPVGRGSHHKSNSTKSCCLFFYDMPCEKTSVRYSGNNPRHCFFFSFIIIIIMLKEKKRKRNYLLIKIKNKKIKTIFSYKFPTKLYQTPNFIPSFLNSYIGTSPRSSDFVLIKKKKKKKRKKRR